MSRTEQRLSDDTLARLFWSLVELSKDLPAQVIKRDGPCRRLVWSEVGEIVRELDVRLALDRQQRPPRGKPC